MFNSILNDPNKSEMVSGEEILLDFYSNSQNFGKSLANGPTFTTFKPPLATKTSDKQTKKSINHDSQTTKDEGIIHLGTRIITDDVPPKNYEGLKSESTISLNNISTLPNKRPAPVIEKNNLNADKKTKHFTDGLKNGDKTTDVKKSDSTYLIPRSTLVDFPKPTKSAAPPPPVLQSSTDNNSANQKIEIKAFERGKLPSIAKAVDLSGNASHIKPTQLSTIATPRHLPEQESNLPVSSQDGIRRANFHIGLPTILPTSYKTEITVTPPTPIVIENPTELGPILKAPEEFSDTIKTNGIRAKGAKTPWKNGIKNNFTTNSFIRPFKTKSAEPIKPVDFNSKNSNNMYLSENQKDGNMKTNIDFEIGNSQKNLKNKNPDKTTPSPPNQEQNSSINLTNGNLNHQGILNSSTKDMTTSKMQSNYVSDSKVNESIESSQDRATSDINSVSKSNEKDKLPSKINDNLEVIKKPGSKSSISQLGIKPRLEIPPNNFIKNKNFRNHLEGIIAKSSPAKTKPPRKQNGSQLLDDQKRKYKFLVEGIDVPKGTFTNNRSDSEEKHYETTVKKKELKGFSYIKDEEQAKQITLKAAQVTARKPHEYVESFTIEKEIISNTKSIDDNDVLRQARANLHAHLTSLKRQSTDSFEVNTKERTDVKHGSAIGSTNGRRIDQDDNKRTDNESLTIISKSVPSDLNENAIDGVLKTNHRHHIPHDTSRIFLRPHDKDVEQLRILQEERYKSLRRKTHANKLISFDEIWDSPKENITSASSDLHQMNSQETENDENGRRYQQSRNGSTSKITSLKQAKIKNIAKNKTFIPVVQQPSSPDFERNLNQVSDRRLIHSGESRPAAEQATSTMHHTSASHHLSDDDNSVNSFGGLFAGKNSRSYKQRKLRHKRKSNLKPEPNKIRNQLLNSSENSENDSYVLYRSVGHSLKSNQPASFKNFDSEPEILDNGKFIVPAYVRVEIEKDKPVISKSIEIEQANRVISGNILVPNQTTKKFKAVSGEVTLPKTETREQIRSKTLPSLKEVSVFGPGVHYKISKNKVSGIGVSTLPPAYVQNSNNDAIYLRSPYEQNFNDLINKESRLINPSKNVMNWSNPLARSMPALDATIVDPELKKVDWQDGLYRVQMKLNAITPGRLSALSGNFVENNRGLGNQRMVNSRQVYSNNIVEHERPNMFLKNYELTSAAISANYPSHQNSNHVNSTLSVQVTPNENILKSQINGFLDDNEDSYAIKSITPTLPMKITQPSTIEFDLELLNAGQTKLDSNHYNSQIPDTVDYEPRRLNENMVSRKNIRRTQNNPVPDSMLLMRDQIEPQNYSDGIPNVIRGSILIRNSLKKNAGRKYLETFTESISKQDNNLFHGKYFQNRENPMYASDLDAIEHGRNVKKVVNERKLGKIPDIAMNWDETDGKKTNVPIKKEWYYDHIWNSGYSPNAQLTRKSGAWKLKSSRLDDTSENRGKSDWNSLRNHSTKSHQHIRQSIDVKREEEELIGPLQGKTVQQVEENLNVDAISERVELSLSDGIVTIEVRVRCERLVPIKGTKDMFRKSAVVVTRKIEIDMAVTPDRKAMYDTAVALSKKHDSADPDDEFLRLSTKDTFELYCKLMEIADEAGESQEGLLFGSLHIDKELEEDARVPYGASSPEVLITEDDLISPKSSSIYQKHRTRRP